MSQIFVRERTQVGRGIGRPRFAIVAVAGMDLKLYHSHVRRSELDKLAEVMQAEIVYLPRGAEDGEGEEYAPGMGQGRRRRGGGGRRPQD